MSVLDTSPTSTDVTDQLAAILEELDVAGGEVTLTRDATAGAWTVQILTDPSGDGRPCAHGAMRFGRYLADADEDAVRSLRIDQAER